MTTENETDGRTRLSGIPGWMKQLDRWCVWRSVDHGKEKPTKIPVNATTGGNAQSSNKSTWCSYADAVRALRADTALAGLGFMLGDGIIGVDVDNCHDLIDGWSARALSVLAAVQGYAERSPSGNGLKIVTRGTIPSSRNSRALGLEVYDHARFFAITGDAIDGQGRDIATPEGEAHAGDLTEFCVKHFGVSAPAREDGDISALIHAKGPIGEFTLAKVEAMLDDLDPSVMSYKDWTDVGQALHHQFEGSDEACELWDEWSSRDTDPDRYKADGEQSCEAKWGTFGNPMNRAALTVLTIVHMWNEARAAKQYDRREHYVKQIEAATTLPQLETELPKLIAKDLALDQKAREALAQQLKRRIKALHDIAHPIADVRGWLKASVSMDNAHAPEWLKPYVYVRDVDQFFDAERKLGMSRSAFNVTHNRDMPSDDRGNPILSAADGAADLYRVPVVDSAIYQPALDRFFVFNHRECVNTYDPTSVPTVPAALLPAEEAAVDLVREHLQRWTTNEREYYLLLSWLAYVVQNPGRKVRWAPYLCGVQGDGKSFIGELLGHVMGAANYRSISGELLKERFTDWAAGQCVCLIEEVKLHGQDKFDAANKIKPFITNETVDVHPKGKPSYNAPNTVNYIIASNYLDGMPVDDDDRRFMFLQSSFTIDSLREFKAAQPDFYERLFAAVSDYPGAIRYWLLRFSEWHRDFKPDGSAPHTAMRGLVIELSEGDIESACRAVFEAGCGGITATWVAVKLFSAAVARELGQGSVRSPSAIGRACADFLRKRGFRYMGSERHRVGTPSVASHFWSKSGVHVKDGDLHNWWPEAEKAMAKSFADEAARDFLN